MTLGRPANEVQSTLSTAFVRGTDTDIVLASGGGTNFPSTSQVVRLTDGDHWCLVIYSSKSGDTLTMSSATDYALAQNVSSGDDSYTWPIGSLVELVVAADYIDEIRDNIDYAASPMVVTGGAISEGTNAGTYKVAALTALLRTTDSETGPLAYVTLAEQDNQAITAADTTYFVCLNYNGGSPTISLSTTNPYAADKRNIAIGKVMKNSSNEVHYISGGYNFQDGIKKLHERAMSLRALELNGGSMIAYSGTNNFTMTQGRAFGGINEFVLSAYDSATTTFIPVYSDGGTGFTEGTPRNTIDYEHYDDGDGTLGNVGTAKYGCHWVYRHIDDGDVYVRYGTISGSLAECEAAQEPTIPDHLTDFGVLVGKIIAPQAGGSFAEIQHVSDTFFTGTAVSDHNQLGNLQGGTLDEYYHLTAAEHTTAVNAITGVVDDTTPQLGGDLDVNEHSIVSASNNNIPITPNGTGRTIIAAPSETVTTKTGTATLTVAEAGIVLVSASADYTLTLPTAVGNAGLHYHFIKTDANYNLITLAANGAETFNYPNDTGAPQTTYPRLNTYCAEVTVISDGANWQCINEKLGQVPEAYVHRLVDQPNIPHGKFIYIDLDTEIYDIGNNFDISNWISGTATSTLANHLVDSGGPFTADMVGHRVKNTTDATFTYITAYNSATDVTVQDNIFVSGETYEIKNSKFVAPIPGRYSVVLNAAWNNVVADVRYLLYGVVNDVNTGVTQIHASNTQAMSALPVVMTTELAVDDCLRMKVYQNSTVDTPGISGSGTRGTAMQIKLVSKT